MPGRADAPLQGDDQGDGIQRRRSERGNPAELVPSHAGGGVGVGGGEDMESELGAA